MHQKPKSRALLRYGGFFVVVFLIASFLQGCVGQPSAHIGKAGDRGSLSISKKASLLQLPSERLERTSDGELEEEPKLKKDLKSHWGELLQEQARHQQDELQQAYSRMVTMDDPDQVDRAMQSAWGRIEQEDRRFTKAVQHTFKRSPRLRAPQIPLKEGSEHTNKMFAAFGSEEIAERANIPHTHNRHRGLMLNQRESSSRLQTSIAAATSANHGATSQEIANLPPGLELDVEASVAESIDF
mmetsp:Transcript_83610/g.132154  ORF Transcript_83610/g.132154 Transcript_83610/m.132154 type:complete len:242 (-) Transcript_83610:31-756(-)